MYTNYKLGLNLDPHMYNVYRSNITRIEQDKEGFKELKIAKYFPSSISLSPSNLQSILCGSKKCTFLWLNVK